MTAIGYPGSKLQTSASGAWMTSHHDRARGGPSAKCTRRTVRAAGAAGLRLRCMSQSSSLRSRSASPSSPIQRMPHDHLDAALEELAASATGPDGAMGWEYLL